jgi:hypothetical protein
MGVIAENARHPGAGSGRGHPDEVQEASARLVHNRWGELICPKVVDEVAHGNMSGDHIESFLAGCGVVSWV